MKQTTFLSALVIAALGLTMVAEAQPKPVGGGDSGSTAFAFPVSGQNSPVTLNLEYFESMTADKKVDLEFQCNEPDEFTAAVRTYLERSFKDLSKTRIKSVFATTQGYEYGKESLKNDRTLTLNHTPLFFVTVTTEETGKKTQTSYLGIINYDQIIENSSKTYVKCILSGTGFYHLAYGDNP